MPLVSCTRLAWNGQWHKRAGSCTLLQHVDKVNMKLSAAAPISSRGSAVVSPVDALCCLTRAVADWHSRMMQPWWRYTAPARTDASFAHAGVQCSDRCLGKYKSDVRILTCQTTAGENKQANCQTIRIWTVRTLILSGTVVCLVCLLVL